MKVILPSQFPTIQCQFKILRLLRNEKFEENCKGNKDSNKRT
jgi:hypothetical protein